MGKQLLNLIDGTTAKILLGVFAVFAFYVLVDFRRSILKSLDKFEKSIEKISDRISGKIKEFSSSLAQHSEDLDRATKDIARESYELKESLMTIQMDVNNQINETKIEMVKLNRAIEKIGANARRYMDDLEGTHGKIIQFEKRIGKNKRDVGEVHRLLEDVKEDYGRVRLIAEKGKATAEKAKQIAEGHSETVKKVETVFSRAKTKKGKNGI